MDFRVTIRKRDYNRVHKRIGAISDESGLIRTFNLGKVIGRGVEGTVYRSEIISTRKQVFKDVAIKTTVIKRSEYLLHTQPLSQIALRKSPYIEIAANLLVNELVLQKICPNFALSYGYNFFDSGKKISGSRYCTVQYNEFIGSGTFTQWSQRRRTVHEWANAIFQILAALYAMNIHYSLIHNDFHGGNVLVQRVKPGGYWVYKIDGRDYYVPNLGYVFLIADYGFAWIPQFMYPGWYVKHKNDTYRLADDYNKTAITDISRQSLDVSNLLRAIEFAEPDRTFQNVFLNTFASISELLTDIDLPQKHILSFFYGSNKKNKELCGKWSSFCYSTKKYVRGERIETYNLNKKVNKSRLPTELRKTKTVNK